MPSLIDLRRRVRAQHRVEPTIEREQARPQRLARIRRHHPAGDEAETRAHAVDHPPAEVAQTRVDADDPNRGDAHADAIKASPRADNRAPEQGRST